MEQQKHLPGTTTTVNSIVLLLFTLSGLTALVYEVVWRRMLSVVLGGSIYATAAVLSAFMGGLCLGSIVVGRWADRWKNPLQRYGLFEILIAAFALVFPAACSALLWFQRLLYPSLGEYPLALTSVKFVVCFVLLLFPTFLMGGTFPLLSKFYLRGPISVGKGVGRLYSVNTLGAVLGTILAGFYTIKTFGARGANLAAIALNAIVGIAAIVLSAGRSLQRAPVPSPPEVPAENPPRSTRFIILLLFALSGFTALSYEVLWTRILIFVVANTTYSFTIMLSTFLLGLALGAYLFAKFLARGSALFIKAAVIEVLIGVFALVGVAVTRSYPSVFEDLKRLFLQWSYGPYTLVRYVLTAMALLPQAILFGMAFPAVVGIYAGRYDRLGGDVGRAYASNTLGAVLGSLAAVFLLIPLLGLNGGMLLLAAANVVIGLAFLGLSAELSSRARGLGAVGIVLVFACVVIGLPPRIDVGTSSVGITGRRGDLIFYREGVSGTVTVFLDRDQGTKMMYIDGNPQVPTDLDALQAFHLLGHLPFFVHPQPKDVLVTAFGGGITTGAILTHPVERVDAVEICPSVFDAAKLFEEENNAALDDKRLRLIVDDANNYVKATNRTYDVIASDATHPGAAESWVLYTSEFYSACRDLLREGGVMCQWVPLHALPTAHLKTILRTFQSVFPHTSLWFARGYTVMLGTPESLVIDAERMNNVLRKSERTFTQFRRVHLESVPAILKNLILNEDDVRRFVADSPIATEDDSPLAFSEREAFGKKMIPVNAKALAGAVGQDFPRVVGATEREGKAISEAVQLRRPYLQVVGCWDERRHVEGLKHLEEALASGWEDADLAWYLRWMTILTSRRYLKHGNLEEGLDNFRRWAKVFPTSPWTRIGLGHLLVEKGVSEEKQALIDEGLAELRKGVEIAPNDPVVLHEVSQAFLAVGRDEEAIPFLEKYVEALPTDPFVWRNLIGVCVRTEQYEKAIPIMEKFAARYPDDPIAWSTLAGAYEEVHRYADAHRALLKALELDPYNPTFQFALRRLERLKQSESPSRDEESSLAPQPPQTAPDRAQEKPP
jgi:spermidine synthase